MPVLVICRRCKRITPTSPCPDCKPQIDRERNNTPTRRAHHSKTHATVKRIVYNRDPHQCVYCGTTNDLTIDYRVALANGGPMHSDNAVIACRPCNSSKGART